LSDPAPPDVAAHEDDPIQVVSVPTRYTVFGAEKLIPEFPPKFPSLVPLTGAAAPVNVISRKSTSTSDAAAQVNVLAVPIAFDTIASLLVAVPLLLRVKVPLIV